MSDEKHSGAKFGGTGPKKMVGNTLAGRWTDTEYQAFCRDLLNKYNEGKKRKMAAYMFLEIMALISDKLLDKEVGWQFLQAVLENGKRRKARGKSGEDK